MEDGNHGTGIEAYFAAWAAEIPYTLEVCMPFSKFVELTSFELMHFQTLVV